MRKRSQIKILLLSLYSICLTTGFVVQNIHKNYNQQRSGKPCLSSSEGEEASSDISWIKDAMGGGSNPNDGNNVTDNNFSTCLPLASGVSGFAIDPNSGFVVVLSGEVTSSDSDLSTHSRFTYAQIAPRDTTQVKSPEALCLVQLAGGLDLGAAVLPPDTLARVVINEIGDDISIEELRPRLKLSRVDVIANNDAKPEDDTDTAKILPTDLFEVISPEREGKIQENAPKIHSAVKNLPGLVDVTMEEVIAGLRLHADESGAVTDRETFSKLLDTLRRNKDIVEEPKVKFTLTVNILGDDSISEKSIPDVPSFLAVALALRYKIDVTVSDDSLLIENGGYDEADILKIFPAFRPIKELYEDAKVMDAFLPEMFFKSKKLENDDKM